MRESAPKFTRLRDLRGYGRIEALNALLVPGVGTYYGWPTDFVGGLVLAIANLGLVIGLVVGACYWLALAKRICGNPAPMSRALRFAHMAQGPMIAAVCTATIGIVVVVAQRGLSLSTGAALVVTILGVLEYVNYYHVQLQHFDNKADLRRLLAGSGFRPAHMARDLATWRRRQTI